jgi:adenylate cyclase
MAKQKNEVKIPIDLIDIKEINVNDILSKSTVDFFNSHYANPPKLLTERLQEDKRKLQQDMFNLELELSQISKELAKATKDKENKDAQIESYNEKLNLLNKKQQIMHISTRITERAESKLLEDGNVFLDEFVDGRECDAVVVSIDIRRSTELMLKARTPKLYSLFITGLSRKLSQCIIDNLGIFDKFTGDGILAFFPDFYSGEDAILKAMKAANECHKIFQEHYRKHKDDFNVFIKDIGLGIGIDFGNVTLVNTSSELTVVGIPVVYACRFSGAPAGKTYLNNAAYTQITELCPDKISVNEYELHIKNEGIAEAYEVDVNPMAFVHINPPLWMQVAEVTLESQQVEGAENNNEIQ